MNPKIKRIIAREGLVIISIIVGTTIVVSTLFVISQCMSSRMESIAQEYNIITGFSRETNENMIWINGKDSFKEFSKDEQLALEKYWALHQRTKKTGAFVFVFGFLFPILSYFLYLLIRFIVWAMRSASQLTKSQ